MDIDNKTLNFSSRNDKNNILPQNDIKYNNNNSSTTASRAKNYIRKRTSRSSQNRRKTTTTATVQRSGSANTRRRNTVINAESASLSENCSNNFFNMSKSNNTTPEKYPVRGTQSSAQIRELSSTTPNCVQPESTSQLSCSMGFLSREKRSISDPNSEKIVIENIQNHAQQQILTNSTQTSQSTLIPTNNTNSMPVSSTTSNNSTTVRIPERFSCVLLKRRKWPLKGWHRRYFVLYRGVLEYGKDKQTVEQQGKLHGRIELHTVVFHNDAKHKKINLDTGKTVYHMKAKDPACYREAAVAFRHHIEYARSVKFNNSVVNQNFQPVFGNPQNSIKSPENYTSIQNNTFFPDSNYISAETCLGFISDGMSKIESLKHQTNSLAILARNAGTYLEVMSTHKGSKWSRSRSSKSNKKWSKDQDFDSNIDITTANDDTTQNIINNQVFTNIQQQYASQPDLSSENIKSHQNLVNSPIARFDSQGNIDNSQVSDPIHTGLTPTQVADELRSKSQELQHCFFLLQSNMLNIKKFVEQQISEKDNNTTTTSPTTVLKHSISLAFIYRLILVDL